MPRSSISNVSHVQPNITRRNERTNPNRTRVHSIVSLDLPQRDRLMPNYADLLVQELDVLLHALHVRPFLVLRAQRLAIILSAPESRTNKQEQYHSRVRRQKSNIVRKTLPTGVNSSVVPCALFRRPIRDGQAELVVAVDFHRCSAFALPRGCGLRVAWR
jgi:hypothetical protein